MQSAHGRLLQLLDCATHEQKSGDRNHDADDSASDSHCIRFRVRQSSRNLRRNSGMDGNRKRHQGNGQEGQFVFQFHDEILIQLPGIPPAGF
ncbi:protein of unknown function [Sterolibacterium denitrificans]|uniref:Uncharacterized protein n=1 Tax=Sterolibacterium denitrificans TaxID=157592 RepID=A0A7Z7HRW4_9PROT|nr:protein of unknown function [Sterolibacterium denitrificans]